MSDKPQIQISKPFGPSIAKVTIPPELIEKLNDYVDKIILEKGYGCEVELVAGATMPTFTSMNEKGAPDVAPELWANAVAVPLKKARSRL